jgi:hypothetical protein
VAVENLLDAREKARLAEETSNVETDIDAGKENKRKRRLVHTANC